MNFSNSLNSLCDGLSGAYRLMVSPAIAASTIETLKLIGGETGSLNCSSVPLISRPRSVFGTIRLGTKIIFGNSPFLIFLASFTVFIACSPAQRSKGLGVIGIIIISERRAVSIASSSSWGGVSNRIVSAPYSLATFSNLSLNCLTFFPILTGTTGKGNLSPPCVAHLVADSCKSQSINIGDRPLSWSIPPRLRMVEVLPLPPFKFNALIVSVVFIRPLFEKPEHINPGKYRQLLKY